MPPTKVTWTGTLETRGWKRLEKLRTSCKNYKIMAAYLQVEVALNPTPSYSICGTHKSWSSLVPGRRMLVSRWGCSRLTSWVEWSAKLMCSQSYLTRLSDWYQDPPASSMSVQTPELSANRHAYGVEILHPRRSTSGCTSQQPRPPCH